MYQWMESEGTLYFLQQRIEFIVTVIMGIIHKSIYRIVEPWFHGDHQTHNKILYYKQLIWYKE